MIYSPDILFSQFYYYSIVQVIAIDWGFLGGSVVKNLPASAGDAGDVGLIRGSGRFPGVRNGNPLHCSCLENSMDRKGWWATVPGVTKSWTQLRDKVIDHFDIS